MYNTGKTISTAMTTTMTITTITIILKEFCVKVTDKINKILISFKNNSYKFEILTNAKIYGVLHNQSEFLCRENSTNCYIYVK
jgi:hypothetical protein